MGMGMGMESGRVGERKKETQRREGAKGRVGERESGKKKRKDAKTQRGERERNTRREKWRECRMT
jgi:hypothetical protein